MSLTILWKGKIKKLDFQNEFEKHGEQWTHHISCSDLRNILCAEFNLQTKNIKLLYKGGNVVLKDSCIEKQ